MLEPIEDYNRQIIFLSDGCLNLSEQKKMISFIKTIKNDCRIFVAGIGNDIDPEQLNEIAMETRGIFLYFYF